MGFKAQTNINVGGFKDATASGQRALSSIGNQLDMRRREQQAQANMDRTRTDMLTQRDLENERAKVLADRNTTEYNYKVAQRDAIPGLLQGDIVNKNAQDYTDNFNSQLAATQAPAQAKYDAVLAAGGSQKDAENAFTASMGKQGLGGAYVNKDNFNLNKIEQGMGTSLREEYNIRKGNAIAANNPTAVAAIEADLGARVKAQDASRAAALKAANDVTAETYKQNSKATQKTIQGATKGTKGTSKRSSKASALGNIGNLDATFSQTVKDGYWFSNKDDATTMQTTLALAGYDAKEQANIMTALNDDNEWRDGVYAPERFLSPNVLALNGMVKKGLTEAQIRGTGIYDKIAAENKKYNSSNGATTGTAGTSAQTAAKNQAAINAQYRKELAANAKVFGGTGAKDRGALGTSLTKEFDNLGSKAPTHPGKTKVTTTAPKHPGNKSTTPTVTAEDLLAAPGQVTLGSDQLGNNLNVLPQGYYENDLAAPNTGTGRYANRRGTQGVFSTVSSLLPHGPYGSGRTRGLQAPTAPVAAPIVEDSNRLALDNPNARYSADVSPREQAAIAASRNENNAAYQSRMAINAERGRAVGNRVNNLPAQAQVVSPTLADTMARLPVANRARVEAISNASAGLSVPQKQEMLNELLQLGLTEEEARAAIQ